MANYNYKLSVKQTAANQSASAPFATEREAIIAVMGATGSGKTTFINAASGGSLQVGMDLQSCTSTVQLSETFELRGRQVTLIDTPGFDDTNKSDADILKMIAAFLATMYEHKQTLAGVIYLHRISDFRMGGISRRNFKMFRELCGDATLKNVVIVTNMWGEVGRDVGEAREAELMQGDKFFKPVLEKGAQIFRHDNACETACAILLHLIENEPLPLRIQTELVDQGKNLSETAAGAELNRELMEQIRKHEHEMRELQKEMQDAIQQKDEETRKELEAETKKLQVEMNRIRSDAQELVTDYANQKAELERRMEQAKLAAEAETAGQHRQIQALQQALKENANASAKEREHLQWQLNEATSRANQTRRRGLFGRIGGALDSLFGS
uniref:G domain-containing protein n=1 Tax=Moniliophthora roreri TaxID=221103 RepID=A0A0W0EUU7_MONRR